MIRGRLRRLLITEKLWMFLIPGEQRLSSRQWYFGNRSDLAGSGVLFTAHPYRKVRRVALWGDYAYGDQGEDIVSGLVTSHPISIEQGRT